MTGGQSDERACEAIFAAITEEFGTSLDSLRATHAELAAVEPDQLTRISLLLNRHSIIAAGQASHLLFLYHEIMAAKATDAPPKAD